MLKRGATNVLVMFAQAAVGPIETYFVGKLGTDALAGMALVFPLVMFMQMTSNGALGGGIASAIVGRFGTSAIAGYGTASRLEYLLVPLVFGLGAPLVAMVGTCIGAWFGRVGWLRMTAAFPKRA